jgi:hypothetical protein
LRELPDRRLLPVGEVGIAVAELGGQVELESLRELRGAVDGPPVVRKELEQLSRGA